MVPDRNLQGNLQLPNLGGRNPPNPNPNPNPNLIQILHQTQEARDIQEVQGDQEDLEDLDHQDWVVHQWEALWPVEVQILQLLLFSIDLFRNKKNRYQIRKTPNDLLSFPLTNLMEQSQESHLITGICSCNIGTTYSIKDMYQARTILVILQHLGNNSS